MDREINELFIAKSLPVRKDIAWHTDDLLINLDTLKELYPNLNIDWDLLRLACIYHDLGKMNYHFQRKLHEKSFFNSNCKSHYKIPVTDKEIPHGYLSIGFIDRKHLINVCGFSKEDVYLLYQAVINHHDRNIDGISIENIEKELINMKDIASEFHYDKYDEIKTCSFQTKINLSKVPVFERIYEFNKSDKPDKPEKFYKYVMLKGLLNRLDYAASAGDDVAVERKNDFLNYSLNRMFEKLKEKDPNVHMNEMQKYMVGVQDKNPIVIGQTGMGKTEGGLLWIGDCKGFFTLPLKSAINAIYKRIKEDIIVENIDNRLGLLHSDTLNEYRKSDEEEKKESNEKLDVILYKEKTKQLSLPLTVCTLDQLFPFVFRYKGFEPILATLSYSKIVIDEIQMYSPDLIAYLIKGLKYITDVGGKFAIMTATMPTLFIDLMKNEGIPFEEPRSFVNDIIRHNVKIIDSPIIKDGESGDICDFLREQYKDKKVLIICNTIKSATKVYKKIKQILPEADKELLNLFHSGFIRKDRGKKETAIMKIGSKGCRDSGIWIATQVVEASLDIDFDLLFTELSDLSGLFQRFGRCFRKRIWNSENFNCYVFTGGKEKCSGVGGFIDEDIFELSKKTLENELSKCSKLSEYTKQEMIKNMYSSENLQDTEYYKKIRRYIKKIDNMTPYSKNKKSAQKEFRDIEQKAVMPLKVYQENEEYIDEFIKTINKLGASKLEKLSAREGIQDLMLPIPTNSFYQNKKLVVDKIINQWESIPVFDIVYDFNTGIDWDSIKEKGYEDIGNRMF